MAHLKRYSIPGYWKLSKKGEKFSVSPSPGPHPKGECIPIRILLRDILKLSETGREADKIIKSGEVVVDKKPRKDPGYPIGLMDVVEIPKIKKAFMVIMDKHGLCLKGVEGEPDRKLCRIQNKTVLKKGLMQLNLHDGRNIITGKKDYKPHDSLLIHLPDQKVLKHFKFDKGAKCVIISGRNIGVEGKIRDVTDRKTMMEKSRVVVQTKERDIETVKEYVLVGEFK